MTLREEVKGLSGNKRRFLLLRIADMDTKAALKLVGVVRGTYNVWVRNEEFVALYRRRDEFAADNKQEAIRLLRRDNQLDAVLLEGKVVAKMKEELDTGEYSLIRTQLAREVYSKLISELDVITPVPIMSWQQKIENIYNSSTPEQIPEGEVVNGEFKAISVKEEEHSQGKLFQESEQAPDETQEETQED